jgi:transcriptional regulator with XRE-family HTH domain
MMPTMVYIGDTLKRERTLAALTQAQLAKQAGVTTATVARIERNEVEPYMTTIHKLADALGVKPRTLIEKA